MKNEKTVDPCPADAGGQTPKHGSTRTQLVPDDIANVPAPHDEALARDLDLQEEVVEVNPDINSMDSRG